MEIAILATAILALIAVVYLMRIERGIQELLRIQRTSISEEMAKQLKDQQTEAALFERFIQEDFSRSEKSEQEQKQEFLKWKAAN
jgi:hypothetical protein